MNKFSEDIEDLVQEEGKVLLNNKNVYFFGDVTPNSTGNFVAAIQEVDSTEGDINIYLCSHGGWAEGGLAMYDAVRLCKNKVITRAFGAVYSAAVLPFIAGDVRIVTKNSMLLLHDMSVTVHDSSLSDLKKLTCESDKIYDALCKIVSESTGMSIKKVNELCKAESYLTAEEAIKYNLADIITLPKKKRKRMN